MLYRFRACNDYLEDELKNNYIYFSDINDFNDYGENNINLIFNGDIIAWKGFLKNYISSFFLNIFFNIIDLKKDLILAEIDYQTNFQLKEYLRKLSLDFLEDKFVKYFLDIIINKKISEKKLVLIMTQLHIRAEILVLWISQKTKMEIEKLASFELFKKELEKILNQNNTEDIRNIFQQEAIDVVTKNSFKNQKIIKDFPKEYLKKIKKLLYPNKYVACFSEKFNNNCMWGYYSDSFFGVCLEFNTTQDEYKQYIELYNKVGSNNNGYIFEWDKVYFKKIVYGNNEETFPEINFFDNIGRVPPSIKSIFLSENEVKSQYLKNNNEWREQYWNLFENLSTRKLIEWEHEKEYRLIMDDTFFNFNNIEERKIKYKFESLNGIIFGIRIKEEKKNKIIEIIANNCKKYGRKEFNFYNLLYINGKVEKQICLDSLVKLKKLLNLY